MTPIFILALGLFLSFVASLLTAMVMVPKEGLYGTDRQVILSLIATVGVGLACAVLTITAVARYMHP